MNGGNLLLPDEDTQLPVQHETRLYNSTLFFNALTKNWVFEKLQKKALKGRLSLRQLEQAGPFTTKSGPFTTKSRAFTTNSKASKNVTFKNQKLIFIKMQIYFFIRMKMFLNM